MPHGLLRAFASHGVCCAAAYALVRARSIDIIVDRAGFEIQWGCLVWVPAVYTLHSRFCVLYPSGWTVNQAALIFLVSIAGVACNYAADRERDLFRSSGGKALVWGAKPKFIEAE